MNDFCVDFHIQKHKKLIEKVFEIVISPNESIVFHVNNQSGTRRIFHVSVLIWPYQIITNDLGPCSHEEADYQMMLHVADMVKKNITKIRIVSNDTGVVVIFLAFLSYYQFRRTLDYFRNRKI